MAKKEKPFVDHGKLLNALAGTSQDTPITAKDLEQIIDAVEKGSHHNRTIRNAITQLIQEGHCIGSSAKGYFMINTMIEMATYIHNLDFHIKGVEDRKTWIKRAWAAKNKKPLLKLKED
jgi:hypothetical protein